MINDETIKVCQLGIEKYGKISVSYLMVKLKCTPIEAQNIVTEWEIKRGFGPVPHKEKE